MDTPANWKGYQSNFLDGFVVKLPKLGKWENDLALNKETEDYELPFIYFSSYQSASRRMPIFTVSNINRENWIQASREGVFAPDNRIESNEQLSTELYKDLNKKQKDNARKMDKGHMVRREDVQWDVSGNEDNAIEAAEATFYYTNACPQHHAVNGVGGIWYNLESSILVRGRTKEPRKAIVFSGPILAENDPYLVFEDLEEKIQCPLLFWKVVYYISTNDELCYAAFLMSQKNEAEADGHIDSKLKIYESFMPSEKPFLDFDDKEKYQVNISVIEKLTGLKFHKAQQALKENEFVKLKLRVDESMKIGRFESFDSFNKEYFVEGIKL